MSADIVVLAAAKIWDQEEIKAFPKNRFKHLGIVSDELLTFYCRQAIAVIMPNINNPEQTDVEDFGLVTLEAAARGGVLLAAATEGIIDAVKDAETGFLLPAEHSRPWIEKINEILQWDEQQRNQFR